MLSTLSCEMKIFGNEPCGSTKEAQIISDVEKSKKETTQTSKKKTRFIFSRFFLCTFVLLLTIVQYTYGWGSIC